MKAGNYMLIICLLLCSCSERHFDTEQQLWSYVKKERNGYVQHKSVNGVSYTLTYRPSDLLVKQELKRDQPHSAIDSLREKYNNYIYFSLSMSRNNQELLSSVAGDRQRFGKMVNQLAFGMADNVHLYTSKKDTIPMADYSYPRMYGMSGNTTMLFVYPRDAALLEEDYFNFTVGDIGFQTGELSFKIMTEHIKNEPKLKF